MAFSGTMVLACLLASGRHAVSDGRNSLRATHALMFQCTFTHSCLSTLQHTGLHCSRMLHRSGFGDHALLQTCLGSDPAPCPADLQVVLAHTARWEPQILDTITLPYTTFNHTLVHTTDPTSHVCMYHLPSSSTQTLAWHEQ